MYSIYQFHGMNISEIAWNFNTVLRTTDKWQNPKMQILDIWHAYGVFGTWWYPMLMKSALSLTRCSTINRPPTKQFVGAPGLSINGAVVPHFQSYVLFIIALMSLMYRISSNHNFVPGKNVIIIATFVFILNDIGTTKWTTDFISWIF